MCNSSFFAMIIYLNQLKHTILGNTLDVLCWTTGFSINSLLLFKSFHTLAHIVRLLDNFTKIWFISSATIWLQNCLDNSTIKKALPAQTQPPAYIKIHNLSDFWSKSSFSWISLKILKNPGNLSRLDETTSSGIFQRHYHHINIIEYKYENICLLIMTLSFRL